MNTIINICKKISLVTFLPFFMLFIIGCSDSEENTEVPDSKNETETPDKEDDSEEGVFYYVRQEAKGTNDGSDWNNAFIDIPESMVRDAVYYIADGEYADYVFDAPEDGEKVITIKKATIDDHGTNVGWEQEFGNEHAQFRSLEINTGFWIIDGSRRTSKKSGHGFRIVVPGDKDVAEHGIRVFGTLSSTRINNISIKYVEFSSDIVEFPDLDGWVVKNGYDQTRGGDNIYIGYT